MRGAQMGEDVDQEIVCEDQERAEARVSGVVGGLIEEEVSQRLDSIGVRRS